MLTAKQIKTLYQIHLATLLLSTFALVVLETINNH